MPFTFDPPSTYQWTPRGDPIPQSPPPESAPTPAVVVDWPKIKVVLLRVLACFPEARAAVVKALLPLDPLTSPEHCYG